MQNAFRMVVPFGRVFMGSVNRPPRRRLHAGGGEFCVAGALAGAWSGLALTADRIETAFESGELSSLKAISSFFAKVGVAVRFRSVRLVRATEGSFEVDGRPITTLDLQNFRRQVALVNVQPTFFDGTVEENLRRAKPNFGDLEEAIELSGFSTILPNLPEGLATNINHGASSLPTTHRQLLALTRALLADPKVLLLDEIFSNLDKDAQLHLHQNLDNISVGRTLVMISHDLKFVTGFDLIVVMEGGRIVGQGSHYELLRNCATYERLWSIEQNLLALGAAAE
jgi:energy-coupling factor transporter ATP-binding protein EcfA2